MNYVAQPKGSNLCGHACLAMILGTDLETAIQRMGHKRKTRTRELIKALDGRAMDFRLRPLRAHTAIPDFCVLRIIWAKNRAHFVVHKTPDVYDPELLRPIRLSWWADWIKLHGGRITSFLRLS